MPRWSLWIVLGLVVLQILGLVPVIHRLRGPYASARARARLDLLETVASLLLFGGMLLAGAVAESWFWLALAGFVLLTVLYAAQGVHRLRARRSSSAGPGVSGDR
jgi:hypothetical protein